MGQIPISMGHIHINMGHLPIEMGLLFPRPTFMLASVRPLIKTIPLSGSNTNA